jgi:hypothetical protein
MASANPSGTTRVRRRNAARFQPPLLRRIKDKETPEESLRHVGNSRITILRTRRESRRERDRLAREAENSLLSPADDGERFTSSA